jgi:signal transduction histidine kinase/CheY-like chemotaxis protein
MIHNAIKMASGAPAAVGVTVPSSSPLLREVREIEMKDNEIETKDNEIGDRRDVRDGSGLRTTTTTTTRPSARPAQSLDKRLATLAVMLLAAFFVLSIMIAIAFSVVLGSELPHVKQSTVATQALQQCRFDMLKMNIALRSLIATQSDEWRASFAAARAQLPVSNTWLLQQSKPFVSSLALRGLFQAQDHWLHGWAAQALQMTQATHMSPNDTTVFFRAGDADMEWHQRAWIAIYQTLLTQRDFSVSVINYVLLAMAAVLLLTCLTIGLFIFRTARRLRVDTLVGFAALNAYIDDISKGSLSERMFSPLMLPELAHVGDGLNQMAIALQQEMAAQHTAEKASKAKSAFLSHMSHEIRTPLNSIIGPTGLLLQTALSSEQRDLLSIVQNSGDTLLSIINNVLDWSKIESGNMELDVRPFRLYDTAESALMLFSQQALDKGVELILDYDYGCPNSLRGDPTRLRQVLVNLLGNAVKFTERGSVVLEVKCLQAYTSSAQVQFAVRDTGIGIAADRLPRLFRSFSQTDVSISSRYGGTGLGLAISQRLVQTMGGRITVESQPGHGSTFTCTVWFPTAASASTAIAPGGPQDDAPADSAHGPPPAELVGKHALLVDSNAINLKLMRRLLEEARVDCKTELMIAHALGRVKRGGEVFDLIVLPAHAADLVTAVTVNPAAAHTRFVVLSSNSSMTPASTASAAVRRRCVQISKPIRGQLLYDALADLLREPETRTESSGAGASAGSTDNGGRSVHTAATGTRPLDLQVLLVEDNPNNQIVARLLLKRLGILHPDVVGDGRSAVEFAARKAYDWILMDVRLPVLDGLQATEQIRRQRQQQGEGQGEGQHEAAEDAQDTVQFNKPMKPWITAMTASALLEDRQSCLSAGMNDYLSKPVTLQDLQQALQRVSQPLP